MKKLMTMLLGLSLAVGAVSGFAQDQTTTAPPATAKSKKVKKVKPAKVKPAKVKPAKVKKDKKSDTTPNG